MRRHALRSRRTFLLLTAFAAALAFPGCEAASRLVAPDGVPARAGAGEPTVVAGGISAGANGGGQFHHAGLGAHLQFSFTALQQNASGDAVGIYHFASLDGFSVNIQGRVTCMTTDPDNPHRAWMGGAITRNDSTHPIFMGPTSQVGRDAWFRVVDYGEGSGASQPDRTTSIFFEPTGGFTTAAQFCASRLWFPDDRVTNPLSEGNIQVHQ